MALSLEQYMGGRYVQINNRLRGLELDSGRQERA